MNEVKISVIIPTHNRPDKLRETLSCLREQSIPAMDYEIIVVDDGSVPEVSLKDISDINDGPSQRLVRLEKVGRSAARNSGARAARGGLLLFLDDDMRVGRDFLAAHLAARAEWPQALRVGVIYLPVEILTSPFGKFRHNLEQECVPLNRGPVTMRNFCAAGNMAIARERFFDLGGFDHAIESSEDQDLALRHTASGGEIVFVPEAEAIHCDGALDIRSYCQRSEWGMKNMLPFCYRYPDWPDNIERERVNGPVRFGREPLRESIRKTIKLALAIQPALETLFFAASLLEHIAPRGAALDRVYRLLLGVHLLRGYRKGIKGTTSGQPSAISKQGAVDGLKAES